MIILARARPKIVPKTLYFKRFGLTKWLKYGILFYVSLLILTYFMQNQMEGRRPMPEIPIPPVPTSKRRKVDDFNEPGTVFAKGTSTIDVSKLPKIPKLPPGIKHLTQEYDAFSGWNPPPELKINTKVSEKPSLTTQGRVVPEIDLSSLPEEEGAYIKKTIPKMPAIPPVPAGLKKGNFLAEDKWQRTEAQLAEFDEEDERKKKFPAIPDVPKGFREKNATQKTILAMEDVRMQQIAKSHTPEAVAKHRLYMDRFDERTDRILSNRAEETRAKAATQRMKDKFDERTTQKQVQKEVEGLEKKIATYQIKDAGLNKKTQHEFRTTPKVVVDDNYKKEIPIEVDPKKVLVEERYAEARANYIEAYKEVYPKNTEKLDEILPPPRFTLFSRAKENLKRLHADVLDAEREREEFGIGETIRNNVAEAREKNRLGMKGGVSFKDDFSESLNQQEKAGIGNAIETETKKHASQDLARTITQWELSEEKKDPEFKADFWFKDQKAIRNDFQKTADEAQRNYINLYRSVFNITKAQQSDEGILGKPLPKLSFKMIFSKEGKRLKYLHDEMVEAVKIAVEEAGHS